jgi:type IV pilus assembly protein PilM
MPPQQMPSLLKSNRSLGELHLSGLMPKLPALGALRGARARNGSVVGLDIQPGYVAAAKARANGAVLIEKAASAALDAETVREGEVLNQEALAATLRELFSRSGLDRRVRIGVANQRTVMRMLEVPPFSDQRELAAAVRFQAEDQMPMPLASAAIDFRPLGVVDTPAGARQRVLLVAAQLDTVQRLLAAVRAAGLQAEGIDLSAFALIRSLYGRLRPGVEGGVAPRVLHLNVGGLTNMVIADGLECRFTRVLGRGLEAIAAEVAERRSMPIGRARELVQAVGGQTRAVPATAQGGSTLSMLGSHGDGIGAEALALQMERRRQANEAAAAAEQQAATQQQAPAEQQAVTEQQPFGQAPAPAQPLEQQPAGAIDPQQTAAGQPAAWPDQQPPQQPPAYDPSLSAAQGFAQVDPSAGQVAPAAPYPQQPDAQLAPEAHVSPSAPAPEQGLEGQSAAVSAGQGPDPGAVATGSEAGGDASFGGAGSLRLSEPQALSAEEAEVRLIFEAGVRSIAVDVRNSLDYVIAQEQGAPVELVVLSGPALDIPGFAELLETYIGLPVRTESVAGVSEAAFGEVSPQYFAIAAGLSLEEVRS